MSRLAKTSLIAATVLSSSIAQAGLMHLGTAEVTFSSPIFSAGNDSVSIFFPDESNRSGESSMGVRAGRFSGSATASGFDANLFYENANLVHLYCIDLYQSIWSGAKVNYDVSTLDDNSPNILIDNGHPERNLDRTLDFLGALNYTLEKDYGFTEGNYNWLNPNSGWMSGAIQLGIWESLYEDVRGIDEPISPLEDWDILSGDFRVAGSGDGRSLIDDDGLSLLNKTFSNINSTDSLGTRYALVLTNDQRQDMIAGDPPVDVPAPATAFLMLAGYGMLRRKRRKN